MSESFGNYRSAVINEPRLASSSNFLRTPVGNVRSTVANVPPPVPPRVSETVPGNYNQGAVGPSYGGYSGFSNYSSPSPLYGGYSGFGGGYGGFGGGYGGYGGGGYSGYGGGYGSFNRYSNPYLGGPNDTEQYFIKLAEESSRPAFQSIESLVAAIGNVAAMLDSTFFAITSSFRAILGVTANMGRLKGVFAQIWQTFAIFRGFTWLYKKILYWLRISNIDPSSIAFKEAFAAAQSEVFSGGPALPPHQKRQSPWPVLAFLSFVLAGPYIIMKMIGNVTKSVLEESHDPKRWVAPIQAIATYDFHGRDFSELSMKAGQLIFIAPKEIQVTNKLYNTDWALATIDGTNSGLIPISYVQGISQARKNQEISPNQNAMFEENFKTTSPENNVIDPAPIPALQSNENIFSKLSPNNFPSPTKATVPQQENQQKLSKLPVIPEVETEDRNNINSGEA